MIYFGHNKDIDLKLIDLFGKEFEQLKLEARDAVAESRLVERNALIASAAIWAWYLSQPNTTPAIQLIKYLPATICAFGWLRAFALYTRLRRVSEYLQQKESQFGGYTVLGWETALAKMPLVLTYTSIAFWLTISISNILVAVLLSKQVP